MTFSPKKPWFIRRFGTGFDDEKIYVWESGTENDNSFDIDLNDGETPILYMQASPRNDPSWLTTDRFVWDDKSGRQQFRLKQITNLEMKILRYPDLPSDKPEDHEMGLKIYVDNEASYIIRMPNLSVYNGFLSIFSQFI